jgi:beta-phosphoglucomutase-like phosphatase (HAD superfamily)
LASDQTFEVLLQEFRRVGVDPDPFSAMLALRPEEALRALKALPDDAGATAFLAQLRRNGVAAVVSSSPERSIDSRRRDKSA